VELVVAELAGPDAADSAIRRPSVAGHRLRHPTGFRRRVVPDRLHRPVPEEVHPDVRRRHLRGRHRRRALYLGRTMIPPEQSQVLGRKIGVLKIVLISYRTSLGREPRMRSRVMRYESANTVPFLKSLEKRI